MSELPPQPRILEIGCGPGLEPTPTLAARGRLTAIDLSRTQLALARAAVPEAEFVESDATAVEFDEGSFDAVVALYVFNHVPSHELFELLRRIGAWLVAGGLLLATFADGPAGDSYVDDWLGVPMFFGGLDRSATEGAIAAAGLALLESRVEPILEPESEPGRGRERVAFRWVLAAKDATTSPAASRQRSL